MLLTMALIGGVAFAVGALVQGATGTPPGLDILALHWLGLLMIATAVLFALIAGARGGTEQGEG